MMKINKLISVSAVDYAAEELKKYLRMMMPEGGDISISYDPEAKDGFRLGLMQDFGLDVSDAEDTELDDILYIDCDTDGGIIAGDNPRSVLLSVYEYLRQNGCRWLFPGVDGEYIPMRDVAPVKYRHKPTMRYRGWCNEGAEYQQCMLDAIDFVPKVGMNTFMIEFRIPTSYYLRHYDHTHNTENRKPEPVSFNTILQWKRQCEVEVAKRGLQLHDIGHGWNADAFGIDSSLRANDGKNDAALTDEQRKYLPLINGKRGLRGDTPNYTQFCMGDDEARAKVVKYVCDYAEKHKGSDYLHVWLGDAVNSHCECEKCVKRTPTDFYIMMLNAIDEELTRRSLNTRIVFIFYTDTVYPPETERIINQERFTMLFAPIGRKYTETEPEVTEEYTIPPYVRNEFEMPNNLPHTFTYYNKWREWWRGSAAAYEYHFWRHQYYDVSGLEIAKRVNEDVRAYMARDINGIIEDGSQRSFFPTGYPFYCYARSMYDMSLTAEEIAEDYFSHAFGERWREFYDYLKRLGDAFDFGYMEGEKSANNAVGARYNPAHAESIAKVREITKEGRALIKECYNSDYRVQTRAVRILEMHADYADLLSDAVREKALGNDERANELYNRFRIEIGKREAEFETCYDHPLIFYSFSPFFASKSNTEAIITLGN